MNICIVCEAGWVLIGKVVGESPEAMELSDASVVRKWNNGKGIGGIAKAENRYEYTLDYIGGVKIRQSKVLFEIPCEW